MLNLLKLRFCNSSVPKILTDNSEFVIFEHLTGTLAQSDIH
uniref:Uncharacterized protein n=1 Tax=Anguilla anguilla TaxID=7936 RepID=A0A0E9U5D6_ANGAN